MPPQCRDTKNIAEESQPRPLKQLAGTRGDQPKSYLSYTYPDIVSRCKRKGKENRTDAAVGVRLNEPDDHLLPDMALLALCKSVVRN